ncbi:MAG: adenylate/guanylate cyclase domain-containing protein, partial [Chloroflexota bacterium]
NVSTLLPGFSWAQLTPYGLIVLGMVYWAFTQVFLQRNGIAKWGWIVGVGGLIAAISLDVGLISLLFQTLAGNNGWLIPKNAAFVVSVVCWAGFMVLAAVVTAIQYADTHSPAHRNRIQYLLISTILLMIGYGLYLTLHELLSTGGLIISWLGGTLLTYIVVAEDLLDLGTGIRRTIRAVVVVVVTVAIYIAGIYLVQIFLGDFLAATLPGRYVDHNLLVAVVAAVLLTIVYTPISRISHRITNRLLFGQRYDSQTVIHQYTQTVSNILDLNDLAEVALNHINRALDIASGALFIFDSELGDRFLFRTLPAQPAYEIPEQIFLHKDTPILQRLVHERQSLAQYTVDLSPQFRNIPEADRQTLKSLKLEWFTPVVKKDQLVGIFGLGPKRLGQPYTAQDIRLLATLAEQTALALDNATLVDRLQRHLTEITGMKHLMDNVFDSIDNGVITIDVAGNITFMNRGAEMILGIDATHCLTRPYAQALPAFTHTVLPNLMHNVIKRGERYSNYEMMIDLPARGKINLTLNLTPLRNAHNQPQGVTVVMDDLTETKRLLAVQKMFRRYVSPAVVDRLPANPADLRLGGHRQEVTILFADIRGFTAFSETLDPEELVDALNQYLSIAATSILMFEGTLDKFMGDAVMGIFNAPLKQPDHVLRAVRAAITMQRAIADYHHGLGEERALSFGVGLHVGEVVVGNVGMSDRMDYTVIGDAVNLAKRIQENAPGGKVLISEAVYEEVKSSIKAVFHKEMTVKGRQQIVTTYEVQEL